MKVYGKKKSLKKAKKSKNVRKKNDTHLFLLRQRIFK